MSLIINIKANTLYIEFLGTAMLVAGTFQVALVVKNLPANAGR